VEIGGNYFFFVAQQPRSDLGHLTVDVSRSQTIKHTQPVGMPCTSDQLVTEATTDATHKKHSRRTSVPSAEFKSAIPAIERPQTYALGRTHDLI
jgi:hypothetical protein